MSLKNNFMGIRYTGQNKECVTLVFQKSSSMDSIFGTGELEKLCTSCGIRLPYRPVGFGDGDTISYAFNFRPEERESVRKMIDELEKDSSVPWSIRAAKGLTSNRI